METTMKALKSFNHPATNQHVRRGTEFSVVDSTARELEILGHAVRVKLAPEHSNKMESPPQNKAAETGPLASHGGAIGEVSHASLSPVDRAPRKYRSRKSKDEPESSL